MWGFSGRGQVFKAVGKVAKEMKLRISPVGNGDSNLKADRIEQIWEEHRPFGWEKYWDEKPITPIKRRWMYTTKGLRRFRPYLPLAPEASDRPGTVSELAKILLENAGVWPWPTEPVWRPLDRKWEEQEVSAFRGEPEPSHKWEAQLKLGPNLRRSKK